MNCIGISHELPGNFPEFPRIAYEFPRIALGILTFFLQQHTPLLYFRLEYSSTFDGTPEIKLFDSIEDVFGRDSVTINKVLTSSYVTLSVEPTQDFIRTILYITAKHTSLWDLLVLAVQKNLHAYELITDYTFCLVVSFLIQISYNVDIEHITSSVCTTHQILPSRIIHDIKTFSISFLKIIYDDIPVDAISDAWVHTWKQSYAVTRFVDVVRRTLKPENNTKFEESILLTSLHSNQIAVIPGIFDSVLYICSNSYVIPR